MKNWVQIKMSKKLKPNNLNLRSEEVQEILSNPPAWIVRWGITLIFMFTCILLILSFTIKYPDFVSAKVLVTTEQPMEKIMARQNGQLEKMFIGNGNRVRVNQRLAIIKNVADIDDVYFLKSIMDTLSIDQSNFSFPLHETIQLNLGTIMGAYVEFEKSYVDYTVLKDLEPYKNQQRGDERSLAEIQTRLIDQIRQKNLLEREYDLRKADFDRYKQLFDKGVISAQEYESKELEFLQMQKNISVMAISISQMRQAVSMARRTLKKTDINKQEDNIRFDRNLIQSYNNLKQTIKNWEDQFVLSSSIDGIVGFQEYWGVNQFVSSGDVVFTIMPVDRTSLIGKLSIPAQNAGKVIVGQKVLVKLDNFPYQQYGMLIGYVTNIAASTDNSGNYAIFISLPKGTLTSYNKKLDFNQELLGNAEIITEDLSIAQRLFYKFKDIFKYST